MNYDVESFTFGVELEYSDVYRFNDLPKGCMWNDKDYTIVNSSGISNDPKGKYWEYGGEINTKPTNTIMEQISVIEQINDILNPKPTVNYKSNLHIHIGVPNLRDDISSLKKLLTYIQKYSRESFNITDKLIEPERGSFKSEREYRGALSRYKHTLKSHQHILPEKRYKEAMEANTFKEFYDAHAPPTKDGNRAWNITKRPGINMRQLKETNTIEFRHFYGTLEKKEVGSCLIWCGEFINNALNNGNPPKSIIEKYPKLTFPKAKPYNHRLQKMWEMTTRSKNDEETIKRNIKKLTPNVLFVCTGNINRSPAAEVILNKKKEDLLINVKSAGTVCSSPGSKIAKKTREILERKEYDTRNTLSSKVTDKMIKWSDVVFYMDNANNDKLKHSFGDNKKFKPFTKYSDKTNKIPDPHFKKGTETHEYVIELIEDCCENYLNSLIGEYSPPRNKTLF